MRRILNLNQTGIVLVKMIGLLVAVIPAALYGISLLWNAMKLGNILAGLMRVSLIAGSIIFVVLLVLIIVEQIQDHYFDLQYQRNRAQKLPLANGNYECQYCGNRKLKESDKVCGICGKDLKPAESELVK